MTNPGTATHPPSTLEPKAASAGDGWFSLAVIASVFSLVQLVRTMLATSELQRQIDAYACVSDVPLFHFARMAELESRQSHYELVLGAALAIMAIAFLGSRRGRTES